MKLIEKQVANRLLVNQHIIMETLAWLVEEHNLKKDLRLAQEFTRDILDRVRNESI